MVIKPPSRRMIPLDIELHCPQCAYDLRGSPEERCPECGFGFDVPALRDLAQRAALMVMSAYQAVFWRGVWLVGFSTTAALPALGLSTRSMTSIRIAGAMVILAAVLLYREYGSPSSWSELLIDWGLPMTLAGSAWLSPGLFELAQWALVVEMAVKLFELRRPFPQLPAALNSTFAPAVGRQRRRAYWVFCAGIVVAILV